MKHLVIPDAHAHYEHNNDRADWLAKLIIDEQPDVVINIGDQWDMPSLSSYDKGKRGFIGRSYKKDIDSGLEFSDRLWGPIRARKRKLPRRVFCVGNHEERIDRALNMSPELEGSIGYKDLELERDYNDIVHYNGSTPGSIEIDGIFYAHYFPSGAMGYAISGEHLGYTLITKQFKSSTCGHTHTLDWCVRPGIDGKWLMGLSAGVYQDYASDWAGERNRRWWSGVVIKDNVEDGRYDPRFVSLDALRKEYGDVS